jgi:hypothetical protein
LKKTNLLLLVTCIVLALMLVVIACSQAATPSTTTSKPNAPATVTVTATPTAPAAAADKKYNVLDPTGAFIPVNTQALAPRLDKLDGKTIYVCQGEADPVVMPGLYKALVAKFTNTKFIYYDRSDFGPSAPGTGGTATSTGLPEDPNILKQVQGVIRGNGW